MVTPTDTPEAPRAPPPRGWRHVRRHRQKTFDEEFPTFGEKLRFIAASAASLLLIGLSLLALLASGYTALIADGAIAEIGAMIVLIGVGIALAVIASAISPFSATSRKGSKKDGKQS